eukprot:1152310-Pelagomonas_calceolata.AAC.2
MVGMVRFEEEHLLGKSISSDRRVVHPFRFEEDLLGKSISSDRRVLSTPGILCVHAGSSACMLGNASPTPADLACLCNPYSHLLAPKARLPHAKGPWQQPSSSWMLTWQKYSPLLRVPKGGQVCVCVCMRVHVRVCVCACARNNKSSSAAASIAKQQKSSIEAWAGKQSGQGRQRWLATEYKWATA